MLFFGSWVLAGMVLHSAFRLRTITWEHVTSYSDLQASTAVGADYSCADRGRITPGNEMPASTQQKADEDI